MMFNNLSVPEDMETPSGWEEVKSSVPKVFRRWERGDLAVQIGQEIYVEEVWLRLSCSRCRQYHTSPSRADVNEVIEGFLGAEFIKRNTRTFIVQPRDRKMYGLGKAPPIVHMLFCKEGEPKPDSFVVRSIREGMM